ncbi:MAG: TraR/DksA family transcriptional regulator [Burkholderiaceae bacterium]|nr:TraR/DksA family transcriptional regulator [Burkholderiaceae bacterium]
MFLILAPDQGRRNAFLTEWALHSTTESTSMDTYDKSMAPRFGQLLDQRLARLRAILQSEMPTESTGAHDVVDFKDMASDESIAAIDEAQSARAARDLEHVLAAKRRLADNSYGMCEACGEPIDLRRLTALPETAMCTACQSLDEHPAAGRR